MASHSCLRRPASPPLPQHVHAPVTWPHLSRPLVGPRPATDTGPPGRVSVSVPKPEAEASPSKCNSNSRLSLAGQASLSAFCKIRVGFTVDVSLPGAPCGAGADVADKINNMLSRDFGATIWIFKAKTLMGQEQEAEVAEQGLLGSGYPPDDEDNFYGLAREQSLDVIVVDGAVEEQEA